MTRFPQQGDNFRLALNSPPRAWLDVLAERQRQIETEGWTPRHDDTHDGGELARAASCYASAAGTAPDVRRDIEARASLPDEVWPWPMDWWKPTTRRRDLVKAAALVLAEIERLDRKEAANG